MSLDTDAGYHGEVAFSENSTLPVEASINNLASACARATMLNASARAAMPVTAMRAWREAVTMLRSSRRASAAKSFGPSSGLLGYPTLRQEAKALRLCRKSCGTCYPFEVRPKFGKETRA